VDIKRAGIGFGVFGGLGLVAGYLWTAFEFPFVIMVPAAVGWYVLATPVWGSRKGVWAAILGGFTFTTAFLTAMFFALSDAVGLPFGAGTAAVLAALIAGAATGRVLADWRAAGVLGGFSAGGMVVAVVVSGLLRAVAPGVVDTPGVAQAAYFSVQIGIVSGVVGAAIGLGVGRLVPAVEAEAEAGAHSTPLDS